MNRLAALEILCTSSTAEPSSRRQGCVTRGGLHPRFPVERSEAGALLSQPERAVLYGHPANLRLLKTSCGRGRSSRRVWKGRAATLEMYSLGCSRLRDRSWAVPPPEAG